MIDRAEEKRLIAQAINGDADAFEILMQENAGFVHNTLVRLVNDVHEAEDLSQEVFLIAWRKLHAFRGDSRFKTWLYRIATNLAYNRLPKFKRESQALDPADEVVLVSESSHVEKAVITTETKATVHAAIAALPNGYRNLMTMRHLQELRYGEIAELTNMPLGTVKTGIFRARKLLRERMEAPGKVAFA